MTRIVIKFFLRSVIPVLRGSAQYWKCGTCMARKGGFGLNVVLVLCVGLRRPYLLVHFQP